MVPRRVKSKSWAPGVAGSALLSLMLLGVPQLQCAQDEAAIEQKWTTADGLPSSYVTGVAHTSDGLLWVATSKGLVRFDGARFHPFTKALPRKYISYLTSGPDSRIYIGTFGGGFATIWRDQVRIFSHPDKLKDLNVSIILPVANDEAWVGTIGGHLYHYKAGVLTEADSGVLHRADIFGLARTPDGVLWIGTGAGLFTLKDRYLARYRPRKPIPFPVISDLAVTESGSLFAATEHGLLKIEGDQWRSWTVKNGLPNDYVEVLAVAGNDLWIGTSGGVAKLSGSAIERFGDSTCSVFCLLPEEDGGVWFGCERVGGLHRMKYPILQAVELPKALAGAAIYSMLEDRSGAVWMASNRGLARWHNSQATLYTPNNGLDSDVIMSLSLAPDNSIWSATDNGFANMSNGQIHTFHTVPKGSPDPIYSILQDKSGTLWVGADHRLLRRRSGEAELKVVPRVNSTVWSLREDSKGNVWAATDQSGLFRLSGGSVGQQYGQESGLMTNSAIDTHETSNGDIWVATARGIVRIRDGHCRHLDSTNGLPGGRSVAILEDGQHRLWIRFTDGIFVVRTAELNRVLDEGSGTVSGRYIDGQDGSGEELESQAEVNNMLQHTSGEMWIALLDGVAKINPLAVPQAAPMLMPKVFGAATDAGERDLTQRIVVKPEDRNLRFTFGAPVFTSAKNLEYRYRLVGFDEQWRKIGGASPVMYTSLPPGKYRFEVSARRLFGSWSNASAPIDLQILPHFYQTWWWYSLTAIASLVTVYLIYRLRLGTVRKHFAVLLTERLEERSRLARELHDTLSRSLVGILVQLDAAQVLVKHDPLALSTHLRKVSQLASEATRETRLSIFALRSRKCFELSLQEMLQQSAELFSLDSSIQVKLDVRENVPDLSGEVKHEILCIVDESLANVHMHSDAKCVTVSARSDGNQFLIEVQDDGVGFTLPAESNGQDRHFGVVGMKERAQRIRGKLFVQSEPGCGTKVSLQVSLRAGWNWEPSLLARSLAAGIKRYVGFGVAQPRAKTGKQ